MSPTPTTARLLAALTAVTLLGAACGSGDAAIPDATASPRAADAAPASASGDGDAEVRIKDFAYIPEDLEVAAGTTVRWTNEDFFGHTVTSGTPEDRTDTFDGVLGEVAQAQGTSYSFTFDEAGPHDYFCRFHPSMTATVTVTD